jgi:tetrahydromethanopterin S-methyltransferase subunit B
MSDRDPAAIEAEIEAQRARLADTVDQLTHKLDPKAQARERAAALKERATTASGRPRPELVGVVAGLAVLAVALVWWRRR